jgi:pimeloyl-ACP methyl ester carboxylesterase
MAKALAVSLLLFFSAQALAKDCALVLMHGKWGSPESENIREFAQAARQICDVLLPEMPWSGKRNYDQTYQNALHELSKEVKALREKGYKRVIVAGQSFGANGAIAYQAYIGDADAVIALAPGHRPELFYDNGSTRSEVDQARTLVAVGKGNTPLSATDFNQNNRRSLEARADVFLSFFDPAGLANMTKSTGSFKKSTPFLWVIGRHDSLYPQGPSYAYSKAPAHPKSEYLVVSANHFETPRISAPLVMEWLKNLD